MKPIITQQEVLFFTRTSFARKEFASKNGDIKKTNSLEDVLEEAFWDGLLFEMLPELNDRKSDSESKLLWQVNNYASSLWMNLSSEPILVDQSLSVDPHQFLATSINN